MMNFLKACAVFASVCMFSPAFADVSEYEHVIHPGKDDGTGFWNVNADWFMYAPAFGFKRVEGAAAYLFKVTDRYGHEHRFDATRPTESLAGVWRELPTGDVHVRCEGIGGDGEFVGLAGERMFWKAEGFREGSYPPAKRGYRAAARGVYDYVFSKKGTRILLETGKVDLTDPIASYASKYCAGLIRAMVSYAEIEPARREEALRVATRAADYLIGLSETEGAPLAWFPPTYAGPGENNTGARNAGKIMLVYPASVASAFVSLSKATGDRRFLEQAERIAATYLRLQGEDGTWYLKMNAADGTPDGSNRLMPIASTIPMFETLFKATGKELYRKAADRAFSRFDATRMADWNWEGQFEDVPPSEAYRNLTKHDACSAAIYFGDRFPGDRRRQAQMRELLRFAEDQFVCWVPPHDGCAFKSRTDWQASRTYDSWQTPCVLEQYECYWPIDSSAAKLIRTYLALYRAEGNPVDLAKAKALGDTMTRVQREDGSIPTWWYNPRCTGNDWVNCMIASAAALAELADACEARTPGHGCITECEKEKMTHTISPVLHKGVLYGFYQAGETHTVEAVWDPTELMRLSILQWDRRTEKPRIIDAGVAGQDFGCFVQTVEIPPCAQTMTVRDDVLHLFFRGRRAKGAPGLWCLRTYDTRTGKMSEGAEVCTLDGKEFNGETARDAYNRLTGDCQVKCAVGDECNVRRFSDGRFYTVMSVGADCVGLVLRSENLRDWTSVMGTPDLRQGATMEYEIFELSKGTWMSAWRQEKLGGVWTATYDVATKTWSSPAKVENSIAVKPYLFSHRGTNYLAANLRGSVTTPGYGTAVRATLGIFRISPDGTLSLARKIVNPTGCHYVSTVEDGEGGLYLFYSTDERKLDATQCRSNIAFDLLEL